MSAENPTTIDLILADADEQRVQLEKRLHMTQGDMVNFFYSVFSSNGLILRLIPAEAVEQRRDAVKQAIQQLIKRKPPLI